MKKHILFIFGLVACASIVKAQVPVPTAGAAVVTNFTGFTGTGFNAAPAAGQLDSDDWSATDTGTPANSFAFGAAAPAAWSQGATAIAVATGGAYALTANTTPPALLLQGSGTFATNMTLTQRYVNNTGSTMTQLAAAYDLIIRNDQARATAVNFSYSTDGVTFVNVPNVAFTTSTTAAGALQTINMATSIQGLSIANGSNFFIRWTIADAGGAGNRDEVGLDNISVTLNNTALAAAADACSTAQNIGTATATATCATNVTSLTFGNQITLLNQSNTTATPANPYIYQAGCNPTTAMPDLARDVWYSVTTGSNTTILNVAISGLTTPSVAIWEGGCGSLTGRGCAVGSAGSLNTNFAGLQPNTTYLLQVSGGTLADVGNFTLSVAGGRDCRPCQRNPATLTMLPQPTNGAYTPGTVVTFTATVSGWNNNGGNGGNNWFSGLEFPTIGTGWTNITPLAVPRSCDNMGLWQYEANPTVTYSLTGNYGAGFYYNSCLDGVHNPLTPSPFDGLGDGGNLGNAGFNAALNLCPFGTGTPCGISSGTDSVWTFRWTATVGNCPPLSDGNDLEFVIRTLSDDETQNGSGPNASASICVNDNLVRFSGGVACCLPPTTTVTNVTCFGGNNGSVQVAADFTVAGTYNYSLFTEAAFNAGGSASQTLTNQSNSAVTFNGLTAGDYVVQSTCNANNCTRRAWFTVTQPATSIAAALTTVNPTCSYSTDGSLTVTASGGGVGAGTYLFAWSPVGGTVTSASPTSTLSGVGVGTYTVTVTSSAASGCSATATGTLTAPTVTVNAGNNQQVAVDALPATNVSLSATAAGGTGPYSYAWTGPAPFVAANTQATTFPNSAVGTYVMTVTATDNTIGCTATDQVAVTVQCQTTFVANASIVNANCTANDGSIALNVGAGNAGYTFLWTNGGATSASLTNLAPAVYTVTITENGTGCTTVRSYPVGTTGVTLITGTSSTPSACASSTGTATVTAVAGTTITWSNAASTSTISNLAPGTYNVTVTNASGCSDVASVTVGSSAGFTLTASSVATACGTNAGTATAIPSVAGSYSYVWSDNNTATLVATRNNLAAGTYNVVASVVGNPACTASATVLVGTTTVAAGASVTVNSVTNETCIGAQNGTINFTIVNGAATLPVTTVISNGLGTFTNGSLPAGNYIIELRDANNCIVTSASATVNAATTLQVSVDRDSVACFGGADGSAIATVSGGTSAYTYSWNTAPVQTTATATGLSAGVRNLVVTDANGCTASASVTILQPTAALSFTLTTTNPTCNNGTNGTAAATAVAGGTAPYHYTWNTGATTSSITNLSSVGVTVTVRDYNNCTLAQNTTLTNPTAVTGTTTTTQVTCVGTATGTATVTPSGGTGAGYTAYQWKNAANVNVPNGNGGNTATISNVVAGTYTVTFADGNGCTGSATATITSPPTLLIGFNPVVNVLCFGGSTGSATAQVANTRGVVTYQWDAAAGNATTPTVSNLPAGTYCVVITDTGVNSDGNNFACTVNSCVTITQPTAPLSVVSIVQDSVDCNGTSTGSAIVAATGGTPGYTYQWANAAAVNVPVANGGQTTTITGQPAGTYTVTITDVNNCTVSASIIILEPAALAITMASNNPLCNGGATGSAEVATITGGTLGYDILWNNTPAGTTPTINGLSAGTYTVTVTDFHNCTITGSVTLVNPPVLTAVINNIDVITPSCNGVCDGSIMVTPGGGVLPYTYLWSNGQTTQTATALCGSNTYTVTVFDANGCTAVASRVLSEPAVLTISATAGTAFNGTNVSCPGATDGSVTTVTAGGTTVYTYLWSNGATTANLTNVGAGIYTVTVTDANGCTATATATLVDPTPITAAFVSSTDPSCFNGTNGSIDISATGGTGTLVYTWTAPVAIATTVQDPTSLPSGNYSVVVSDANACSAAAIPVVLNNPTQVTNTATTVNNVTCNGFCNGNIAVAPTGGTGTYTYIWSDGQTTNPASALCVGTYSVTFADANGCTASVANIAITEPTVLTATAAVTSNYNGRDISCPAASDGEVTTTGAGGTAPYTYLWSVGAATTQVVPGLLAGTYCVTITDANACTATACINVVDPPAIVPQVVTFVDPSCFAGSNGTITVGVASGGTGAFTFLWDAAAGGQTTATATGLAAGIYTCTITDANGCTASISQTLNEPADLVVTPSVPTPYNGEQISCNTATDGSIVLTVAGGTGAINSFTYTWNPNTVVGQNPTNLGAGTYAVTVTDLNGCIETATATLVAPAALNASVASTANVLCFAGATGAINLTVFGGTTTPASPYIFAWSDGQTTQNATGLVAGTYAVTVSDANGCQVTINNIVITEPSQLTTTATVTSNYNGSNISCTGASDGAITATPSGGTPVYTYAWSNGATTQAQNNLPAGTYDVTVTDFNGCTVSGTVTLVDPTPVTADAGANQTVNAGTLVQIGATPTASGGTGIYTYSWSGAGLSSTTAANPTFTPATPGSYAFTVTVTDANGCTATDITVVTVECSNTYLVSSFVENANCGLTDGAITLTVGTNNAAFTYNWSAGTQIVNGNGITSIGVGTYDVTITETATGCTLTQTYAVGSANTNYITSVASTPADCGATPNGTATVTLAANTPAGATITWSDALAQTTTVANGLAAGSYNVTVTAAGCSDVALVTVGQQASFTASLGASTPSTCGAADGIATISTSVAGAYDFVWSDNPANNVATRNDLVAGTYVVIVTDQVNGCSDTVSFNISTSASPTASVVINSVTHESCPGANNGFINFVTNYTGANTPTTVVVTDGLGTYTNGQLPAGDYCVELRDATNCVVASACTTINAAQPLVVVVDEINVQCNGLSNGGGVATVTGGAGGYSYIWNGVSSGTININNTQAAGNVDIVIADANGCTVSNTFVITEPTPLTVNLAIDIPLACNGDSTGQITATVAGGTPNLVAPLYTYVWSGNSVASAQTTATITGLPAGTYNVSATDANGCLATGQINLNQNPALQITANSTTSVTCNGGSDGTVNIDVVGGTGTYTYLWSNTAITEDLTGVTAGTYTLTITDSNGCTISVSSVVSQPLPITITLDNLVNTSCFTSSDGAIDITVTGGTPTSAGNYFYSWNSGLYSTQDIAGLPQGPYTLTVTDNAGCTATFTSTVGGPTQIVAAEVHTDLTCNAANGAPSGTITLTPTGGSNTYTYQWTSNVPAAQNTLAAVTGLAAGNFGYTVTDGLGCSVSGVITLSQPSQLTATFSNTAPVLCFGQATGQATITAAGSAGGAYTYNWASGVLNNPTATNLVVGLNTVTVVESTGCTATFTVPIGGPTQPISVNAGNLIVTNPTCAGGNDGSICITQVAGGTAPYNFAWSTAQNNPATLSSCITGLTAGTYSATITDANNCPSVIPILNNIIVTDPDSFLIDSLRVLNVSCTGNGNGSATVMSVTGGAAATYAWSNGRFGQTVNNLVPGSYDVTVTSQAGCTVSATFTITEPALALMMPFVTADTVTCYGDMDGTITIDTASTSGGTPQYTYSIDGLSFTANDIYTNLASGYYYAYVRDANGCTDSTEVYVATPEPVAITLNPAFINLDLGETGSTSVDLQFTPEYPPLVYTWSSTQPYTCVDTTCASINIAPVTDAFYNVTVTDANGCLDTARLFVNVKPNRYIFIPTAFTPNGDLNNDVFMVYGGLGVERVQEFMVFDRWGELMYAIKDVPPTDVAYGWDGKFNGKPLNPGVFVYYAKVLFVDGREVIYKGDVSLIR